MKQIFWIVLQARFISTLNSQMHAFAVTYISTKSCFK